jgi:hypothetical protein
MKNIVIINRAQLLGGGNNNTCTFSYTSIVDNTCIQVLQSYISRDPILKNLWLSLFINFLFISIHEKNWLAESMFFRWGSFDGICISCEVVEFTTICAIVAYHHLSWEFEPHSWRGVPDKTLCDKVCQWLATVYIV